MAISDPMDGLDGTLKFCVDEYADENTGSAVWTTLGFVTGFDISMNINGRDIYNKRTKVCTKYGRNEYTGTMSALYVSYSTGLSKIFNDRLPVALKLEVDKGDTGSPSETRYYSNVSIKSYKESYGNLNDGGDVTVSIDFSFEDCHAV